MISRPTFKVLKPEWFLFVCAKTNDKKTYLNRYFFKWQLNQNSMSSV